MHAYTFRLHFTLDLPHPFTFTRIIQFHMKSTFNFQTTAICFTLIIGSIVSAATAQQDSKVQEDSLTSDTNKQTKRAVEDNRQANANSNSGNLNAKLID